VKKSFACIAHPSGNWLAEWVGDVVLEGGVGGAVSDSTVPMSNLNLS